MGDKLLEWRISSDYSDPLIPKFQPVYHDTKYYNKHYMSW
jgi:hypothetical protein